MKVLVEMLVDVDVVSGTVVAGSVVVIVEYSVIVDVAVIVDVVDTGVAFQLQAVERYAGSKVASNAGVEMFVAADPISRFLFSLDQAGSAEVILRVVVVLVVVVVVVVPEVSVPHVVVAFTVLVVVNGTVIVVRGVV